MPDPPDPSTQKSPSSDDHEKQTDQAESTGDTRSMGTAVSGAAGHHVVQKANDPHQHQIRNILKHNHGKDLTGKMQQHRAHIEEQRHKLATKKLQTNTNDTITEDHDSIAVPPGGNASQPIEFESRDIMSDPKIEISGHTMVEAIKELQKAYYDQRNEFANRYKAERNEFANRYKAERNEFADYVKTQRDELADYVKTQRDEITHLRKENHALKSRLDILEKAALARINESKDYKAELMENSADIQKYSGEYKGLLAKVDAMQKKTIENSIRAHTITKIKDDNKTIKAQIKKKRLIIENDEYNFFNPYRALRGKLLRETKYRQQRQQQIDLLSTSLESLSTSDPTSLQELEAPQEQELEKHTNANSNEEQETRKVRQAMRRKRQKALHGKR